jgi:hypothetical protein
MPLTLNEKLACIGVRTAGSVDGGNRREEWGDMERTLIEAVLEFPGDARLVSLIMSWIKVHGAYVIVEKLRKLAGEYSEIRHPAIRWVSALAAFGARHCGHKWKKLVRRYDSPLYLFPEAVTKSACKRKGHIEWLARLNFIVPTGSIRIREDDVLAPRELIKRNRQYRNRYLYGPSWRADIITAIEAGARSPMEICKTIGCSYEPAHRIFREFKLALSSR